MLPLNFNLDAIKTIVTTLSPLQFIQDNIQTLQPLINILFPDGIGLFDALTLKDAFSNIQNLQSVVNAGENGNGCYRQVVINANT